MSTQVTQPLGMSGPYSLDQINENMRIGLDADAARINAQLVNNYNTAIDNWKKNKDAGHPTAIPSPENSYRVFKDPAGWWTIAQDGQPVCPKYVDGPAPPVAMIVAIGAAIPGMPGCFSRGYNSKMEPDNAPDGYLVYPYGPSGPAFRKVIKEGFFGGMFTAYYQIVLSQ